jgi:serine/threonine protein kinase
MDDLDRTSRDCRWWMAAVNRAPDQTVAPAADAAGSRRAHRTLVAGTVLEQRYEIQRVAGRGGMSTVYVARDLRFGQVERLCAVKEMFDVDPDARVRALRLVNFERESALLATLSHPSIPKIYDYFSQNGIVYLVLEYIDGHDLERLLANRDQPFSGDEITRLAIQVCDVLEMLHDQKPDPIIFRDLKPSNIMLRSNGQVVLIDFGIARTIQGRQRGTMIGTEGYAPPEQYRGIADARGDIYALGATLHHLATNSDPRLETPFTFQERPVRSFNAEISEELAAVIMKMLAYNAADRYQAVRDVRADLESLRPRHAASRSTPSQPALAHPSDVPISFPTHRATTILDVAPAPAVDRRAAPRKRAARRRSEPETLSERIAWATQTGDEVRGSATFDGTAFAIGSYDHHLYVVSPVDGSIRWRFRTNRGVVSRPAMTGNLLIFGSEDNYVYAVDRDHGTAVWTQRTGMPVRSSPLALERTIVIGSDDAWVYGLDIEAGSIRWRHRTWGPIRSSPVAGDGLIYVGCDDSHLYALDAASGRLEWRAPCFGAVQSAPAVAGARVVVASRGGAIHAFDAVSGARQWQFDAGSPVMAAPRTAAEVVVFGSTEGTMFAINVDDGALLWSMRIANQITATALIAGGLGYVGTVDGDCVCFNVRSGEIVWRHQVGGSLVSTPAYGNGVIVVGSTDGRICGIALTASENQALQRGG